MDEENALKRRVAIELEKALTASLRVSGTRHDVLASFLTSSEILVREIASSPAELAVALAVRSNRGNSLRDLLGIIAKHR